MGKWYFGTIRKQESGIAHFQKRGLREKEIRSISQQMGKHRIKIITADATLGGRKGKSWKPVMMHFIVTGKGES